MPSQPTVGKRMVGWELSVPLLEEFDSWCKATKTKKSEAAERGIRLVMAADAPEPEHPRASQEMYMTLPAIEKEIGLDGDTVRRVAAKAGITPVDLLGTEAWPKNRLLAAVQAIAAGR